MEYIKGTDRQQIQLLSLEQMVHPQSFARIIDAYVDMLDLRPFNFKHLATKAEDRTKKQTKLPFNPADLLKLYLFGYQTGVRSCRKLAYACQANIEVMWLIKGLTPHYKTIADFRKDNKQAFRKVFRHFVAILKDWELIEGKTIGIDSFKIRAQNALKNNYNQKKIDRHQKYIDTKVDEYLAELDQAEKQHHKEKQEALKQKLEVKEQQKEKYNKLQAQLDNSEAEQISTTDPDAKAVVFQRNAVKVGYNVQAASDAKHKLLVAMDTGDVNDTKALKAMTDLVCENLEIKTYDVIADKGYHSGSELKEVQAKGISTYVSPKESSSTKKNSAYAITAFTYNEKEDSYTCPQAESLTTNGNSYNKKPSSNRKTYKVKHYKTKACNTGCAVRDLCTKNKNGRYIERTEYQPYINENNNNVNTNKDYYRTRQQIIEHQFGTIKRQWHFDYLLLKGKEKVLAEVSIVFTAYNLRRCVSILGFDGLMSKLKAHFATFLQVLLLCWLTKAFRRNKILAVVTARSGSYVINYYL